ncbi:MAG: DUF445 family protein [Desulfofustis sp.]
MLSTIGDIHPYVLYLAPPLVGAFIGYLTNRVAIRMLFRPLRGWYLGPFKIPMTPGVIPSKRHELAVNIGEMVGEHLVTGDEINRALQKEDFQEHLRLLIEAMTASITKKEFGPIRSIVPERFRSYLDVAYKTVTYRIKEHIRFHLGTEGAEQKFGLVIDRFLDQLLSTPVDEIFSISERKRIFTSIAETLVQVFESKQLEKQLTIFLENEIDLLLQSGKSSADLLPKQLNEVIIEIVRNQTPHVLDQAAALIKDPDIKDKIVAAIINGVDEFIDTLGPMSTMARGFLDLDMVEEQIRIYFEDKEDEIDALFHDEQVAIRVRAALGERMGSLLETPLAELHVATDEASFAAIAKDLSGAICSLLRKNETRDGLAELLHSFFQSKLGERTSAIGSLVEMTIGNEFVELARSSIRRSAASALQSPEGLSVIDHIVDEFCSSLLHRPVGRLDHLVPSGVIEGACRSLREMTTRVLVAEVPSVVALIRIKDMVSDKIDSYDLLRLEQLLLSIMAEQFKYINLFGALLGFIIGCANLIFLLAG